MVRKNIFGFKMSCYCYRDGREKRTIKISGSNENQTRRELLAESQSSHKFLCRVALATLIFARVNIL